ncbi:MAG: glycosyltransferase [Solobacterium sp.]|jgi:glycosyltransferase involved in cell wall biosynthesis|nr:glycosyltransferase [Solobacterium sp.]
MLRINKDIKYSIDSVRVRKTDITITGWANSKNPKDKIYIDVTDSSGNYIKYEKKRIARHDVDMYRYGEIKDELFGFTVKFPYEKGMNYEFKLFNSKSSYVIHITDSYLKNRDFRRQVKAFLRGETFRNRSISNLDYNHWYQRIKPSEQELERQKKEIFPENAPMFSIIIPLYETPAAYLEALISSLLAQTYANFEVCFADGSSTQAKLEQSVTQFSNGDKRIKYKFIGENKGISGNTNEALHMASGNFIVLCDHDDLLTPNALYEFAKAIVSDPDCDSIYSDEDKINEKGTKLFDANFKSDFNPDMLTSVNYICHLFGVRKTLIDQYGEFDSAYDGAQDYDFILRMTEHSRKIIHIAKVLYHWRTHQNSTSANPESKLYAYEAGARAIAAHYHRVFPEILIDKVEKGISLGIYHTHFKFTDEPLVSIIIPNKDHTQDLETVLQSIIRKSTWTNLEFIIVENNSTENETQEYYDRISAIYRQVHVVYYKGDFNFSKICNYGASCAHGDYLLFMNNDVEMINPEAILEMMGYAQRPDVGIVGCRLLYDDETIQHAGVVVGIGGVADHIFRGHVSENNTYFNLAMTARDYSAVTAAVMMVRRDAFEEAQGFDENYAVAFNDIDFCLKVRKLNRLVVYNPYASFHHYESKSRGAEDTYEKQVRFAAETKLFVSKWKNFILDGDPYYNQNLTVHNSDFSCRNLAIEKIGDTFYKKSMIHAILTESPEQIVQDNQ